MSECVRAIDLFRGELYCNRFPNVPSLAEANYFLQFDCCGVYVPRARAEDRLDFEMYLLLVTRDTREILPIFFSIDEQNDAELDESSGHCIVVEESGARESSLSQEKLRQTIERFNRNRDRSERIDVEESIEIASAWLEPTYLNVKAVLLDGDADCLVVSAGAKSHSELLRRYLERQSKKVSEHLKKLAKDRSFGKQKYIEVREAMTRQQTPFDGVDDRNSAERERRADEKLAEAMTRQQTPFDGVDDRNSAERERCAIEKLAKAMTRQQTSLDGVNDRNSAEREGRADEKLAKAIGWALHYHLRRCPPPAPLLTALGVQSPLENEKVLRGFAAQLQLDLEHAPNFFDGVSGADVKLAMTSKTPALVPLLALNLAVAVREPESNFLAAMNTLPNDPFDFLERLDRYGNSLRLDETFEPIDRDDADKLYDTVRKFISTLLPDFDEPTAFRAEASSASLRKLNAELSIVRSIGEENFEALPTDIQEILMRVSPDKDRLTPPTPVELVKTLASILEKMLRRELRAVEHEIAAPKSHVIERLRKLDQAADFDAVSEFFYKRACNGETATLEAYALAYFASLDDERLERCAAKKFPELVSKIAEYRGHGNNLNLMLEVAESVELRARVFDALKNGGRL